MKNRIIQLTTEKGLLEKEIAYLEQKLLIDKEEKDRAEEANSILVLAAQKTQKNISTHFSKLVDQALAMVWGNPYTFEPDFVERRGRTECDLWFVRNEKRMRPRFSVGGGPKDVASFILRLAYSRLERTAPMLVLDEPLKNLDINALPLAIEMMRFITEQFGVQLILNTHVTQITEQADKVFNINTMGGKNEKSKTNAYRTRKRKTSKTKYI